MGGWGRLFWPPTYPLVSFLVDFSDARRGFLCVCRCVCFRTFTKKKEKKNFKRYKTFGCRATGLPVTVVLKYEVQCMTQLLRSSFRMGQGVWEGSGSWRIVSTCPALSGRRTLVLLAKKKKKSTEVQQQGAHNGGVSCWFRGLPKSTALHCRDGPSVWSTTFFKNFLYYFPPLGVAITLICKVIWWLRSAMKSGESVDGSGG